MIGQQPEFDFKYSPPASKSVDPSTSDQAESEITKSGKRGAQCRDVLAFLQTHPGHTSAEIAHLMKPRDHDWRYTVARRLPDLMNHRPAMAKQSGKRVCNVTGKRAVLWYPVP